MSDGDTGSKKSRQGGWMKTAKELNDFLKEQGFENVDELREALEAQQIAAAQAVSVGSQAGVSVLSDANDVDRLQDDEVADDLAWITEDTGAVYLASRFGTISLRPAREAANPPMDAVSVFAHARGEWRANPFNLRSDSFSQTRLNWIHYGRWSFIAISADNAMATFDHPLFPMPDRTVISGMEFKGWDKIGNRPRGVLRPLKEKIPLREAVRRTLMRQAGLTFIDPAHHALEMPNVSLVNPYGNSLGGLELKLPNEAVLEALKAQ